METSNNNEFTLAFYKSLYDEKLKHKEIRNQFIFQKVIFCATLFGVSSFSEPSNVVNLSYLLILIPLITFACDCYIYSEDYKVKRIGSFLKNFQCCNSENIWEYTVNKFRDKNAAKVSITISIGFIIFSLLFFVFINQKVDNQNKLYYVIFICIYFISSCLYILISFIYKRSLNQLLQSFESSVKKYAV